MRKRCIVSIAVFLLIVLLVVPVSADEILTDTSVKYDNKIHHYWDILIDIFIDHPPPYYWNRIMDDMHAMLGKKH